MKTNLSFLPPFYGGGRRLTYCRVLMRKIITFKFYWMMYYICGSLIGGLAIAGIEGISTIDGIFLAAAAICGGGLSTIPMFALSKSAFCILSVLMMIGCVPFMLLLLLIYKRHCFEKLKEQIHRFRNENKLPLLNQLYPREREIISEYNEIDDAVGALTSIVAVYYVGFLAVGILILYAILQLRPLQRELLERNFTFLDSASFLAVSAFSNTGFALTTDNLIGLRDNPCAYIFLTVLIVAGNTMLPIILRAFINLVMQFNRSKAAASCSKCSTTATTQNQYIKTLQFILDNPSKLTTHLFSNLQTKALATVVITLILIQYIFFLGSTMGRAAALQDTSQLNLAGIGYFQTLSTRNAGFNIIDLRELNQGLLFVYFVMMYISSLPIVSVVQLSSLGKPTDREFIYAPNPIQFNLGEEVLNSLHQSKAADSGVAIAAVKFPSSFDSDTAGEEKGGDAEDIYGKLAKTYILRHSFFLFLAVLICAYSEDKMLSDPSIDINLWYVIFEIVSAYGSVGLSLGVPGESYSLSGGMTGLGKCVIIFIMLLGKHRGLPSQKDEPADFTFMKYRTACRYYEEFVYSTLPSQENPIHNSAQSERDDHV